MGAVKLCDHRMAKTPYYVESAGIRFYSIEELAYYLYKNIYLADEDLINERLCEWLDKEIGMKALADRLKVGSSSGTHIYNQVMTILQASEYFTESELRNLSMKIQEISGLQTQERMKCKADELMENGNFWAAVLEYERILGIRQNSRLPLTFYARVWNNLACGYAQLFLFGKAASCFETAYQFQKLEEYKEKAYYARMLLNYEQTAEKTLEKGFTEEFIGQSERRIAELEKNVCQSMTCQELEQFLKTEEKKYARISGRF